MKVLKIVAWHLAFLEVDFWHTMNFAAVLLCIHPRDFYK